MALELLDTEYVETDSGVSAIEGVANASFVIHWRRRATGATNRVKFGNGNAGIGLEVTDVAYYLVNGFSAYGYHSSNDTDWHASVWVYDGGGVGNANRLKVWFDGSSQTLTFGGTIPATTPSGAGIGTFNMGRRYSGDFANSNMEVAEIGIWNVTLTTDEAIAVTTGASPAMVRPTSLQVWWDLQAGRYIERLTGNEWSTGGGTPAAAVHPRIYYPSGAVYGVPAAAAPAGDVRPRFYHHRHHNRAA